MKGSGVVVANPGFEQVAQNIERVSLAVLCLSKTQKTGGDRRFFCLQMKVCDKKCRHDYSLTVTLSITTSSFGTS
jgi:hypothetical protein